MIHPRIVVSLMVLALLWPAAGRAADKGAPTANRGPQAEEFYRLHGKLNALVAELAGLQLEYRTANDDRQAVIQQEWQELIAKGKKLEPKLLESARRAYAEAPNADKDVTEFLVKLLAEAVQRDDYEPAAEIGKLLMENQRSEPSVCNLAGIAAFATNEFDAAKRYLGRAEGQGYYRSASSDDRLAQLGAVYLVAADPYKEAWERESAVRKAEAETGDLPRVLLVTTKGEIVVELFENQAPNTVANFIFLVKKGFYNGLSFHRVLQGFMAQGGDPAGDGSGGPNYSIACECYRPDHRRHFRGSLSMAHRGRDTGGSQFFLTFAPAPHLDGKHTVFGRVISGMDVLAKLQRRKSEDSEAPPADKILEARVLRKRPHEYVPQTMPE